MFYNPAVRPENTGRELTYNQGRFISLSVGGVEAFCPTFAQRTARGEKLSAAQVLSEMGLTRGAASAVIQKLVEMGYDGSPQTGARAKQAQSVLMQAGISCPGPIRQAAPPPPPPRQEAPPRPPRPTAHRAQAQAGSSRSTPSAEQFILDMVAEGKMSRRDASAILGRPV